MANLLLNAGFETVTDDDFDNWTEYAAGTYTLDETTIVHGGSHALRLLEDADDCGSASQAIASPAGGAYKLTFWYYGDATYEGEIQIVQTKGAVSQTVLSEKLGTGASWQEKTIYFMVRDNSQDTLTIELYTSYDNVATYNLYFDDFVLETATNLIVNGDLESVGDPNDFADWDQDTAGTYTFDMTSGSGFFTGGHSMMLVGHANEEYAWANQFVDLVTSGSCVLTFWARGDGSDLTAVISPRNGGDWGEAALVNEAVTPATDKFTRYAFPFYWDANTYDNFRLEFHGNGSAAEVAFDNAIVVMSGSAAEPEAIEGSLAKTLAGVTLSSTGELSANLVQNGGFENLDGEDDFSGWTEVPGADGAVEDEASLVHAGSHAVKLTHGAQSGTWIAPTTAMGVSAETDYTLSFWTRGDGTNAGRVTLNDNVGGGRIIDKNSTGVIGTTYEQVFMEFTTPAGCTEVVFGLMPANVEGAVAYFDDVAIEAGHLEPRALVDGGLEEVTDGAWDHWTIVNSGSAFIEESEVHTGDYACKCTTDGDATAGAISQTLDSELGTAGLFRVRFWAKDGDSGNYALVSVLAGATEVKLQAVELTTSWAQYDVYALIDPDSVGSVQIGADAGYGVGPIYIDDISIDKMASWSAGEIFNGGFENTFNSFAGWTANASDGFDEETIVHSGLHALRLAYVAEPAWINTCVCDMHLEADDYVLTFWTRGDGTVGGHYIITLDDDTVIAEDDTEITGTTWTKIEISFTVAVAQRCHLILSVVEGTVGYTYCDDLSLTRVTDPVPPSKLVNAGFESLEGPGIPVGWTVSGAETLVVADTQISNAPRTALKISKVGDTPGYAFQDLFVDPGFYTFRIWARGDGINEGHWKFYGVSAAGEETLLKEGTVPASTTWARVAMPVNYPSGYDRLRLYLYGPLDPA